MFATKTFLVAIAIAYVEARFGQEQVPISAIGAVQGGSPGAAATVAGAAISDLLGAANSCAKLTRADQIVTELGGGADAIAAAIGMVTAEKNTNPFVNGNVQNVCADATLPKTPELRGITPLIDPAVDVKGDVNALSASSKAAPLDATGKSVFDLIVDAGFGDLVKGQDATGGAVAAAGGAGAGANAAGGAAGGAAPAASASASAEAQAPASSATACAVAPAATPAANGAASANTGNATSVSSVAGADFGLCTPTISFQGGEGNRPATEFTFQIIDPVARGGQGEALNPNIITNALCNQLTNVCKANQAAKDLCLNAKAQVAAAGTRNKSTADLFNSVVGFAGAVTNPAGGPDDVPAAAAAAARALRLRALEFRA
ncbi:hypothetical protein K504DRAFT_490163 [Pleomassaria siparia CBS 279.74]|uniref:Circumsporozoite protein n=1 Tax=Pleomassaria siparia CBS 279.74 TaxID=1314801 RepID=A0A6G1KBI5_9PLEO|nr:hypothetical protein K504DRAFT_490163 [Pleomassaria siparia CBS 279.74]